MIDVVAGETLNNKTLEVAREFIKEMALNNYQWKVMRKNLTKVADVFNIDVVAMLACLVKALRMINPEVLPSSLTWSMSKSTLWGGQENQMSQPSLGFQQPYHVKTRFRNTKIALRNQQESIQGLENQII
ncbi:pentatricopeptide repeat-containing protein chloroplastic-like [Gossypium australe]|uniref:Pentatricopeptide repeat-containing protein chloroplastic-like n=1 Tax=Gossypium australe TaxID=47621 RepID=A0A5B6VBV4_9ROSI|nr:pentatricopeptide repeat-containing protein chloroplastic-like [Gossypium australe]